EHTVAKVKVTDSAYLSQSCVLYVMQHLYAKLSEINEEFSSAKMFYEARCSGLMLSVLSEIAFYAEGQGERAGIGVVDGVIDYLAKHYAEDISNATLGEMFGYHPNYLNQLFIRFTGKSLHKYLLDLRILHAVKLLQDTDLSVCAVANEVGFRDVPHFSRYFKQKMGCSPVKFR
ncbi:MAG: AraC family transcriptional regulator, partial [Acutalibacteraceae bacterium]|nr:AraC family transcriptional regulator [Acutalibacteraceae bacterium]